MIPSNSPGSAVPRLRAASADILFAVVFVLVFAAAGTAAARFAVFDGLASLADDSVSYLIMGQVLSPWVEAVPPVRELFPEQSYPPLFAWLLAVTGAAHDLTVAHALVVLSFVAACLLLYGWARRVLSSRWLALGATAVFAVSPAAWGNLLGILSESPYLVLTLGALFLHGRSTAIGSSRWTLWATALAVAAAVLTRTIGLSLLAAMALADLGRARREGTGAGGLIPVGMAALAVAVGYGLWSAPLTEHYLDILGRVWSSVTQENAAAGMWALLVPQLRAVGEAWLTSWVIYWFETPGLRLLAVVLFGLSALLGVAVRVRSGRLDAWYVIGYLLVLLAWPAPGQMVRLLYPVVPVLLVQSLYGIQVAVRRAETGRTRGRAMSERILGASVLVWLAVVSPSLAFYYHRAQVPEYGRVTEFYRIPDLEAARAKAAVHRGILRDMGLIRRAAAPDERVLWFTPEYVALLAQRHAAELSWRQSATALRRAAAQGRFAYVYLTRLHPRRTGGDVDGLALLPRFSGWTTPVWRRVSREDGRVISVLLRVDHPALGVR